ncbi:MAG: thiamine-phosphate kinase [Acidobacteria bacterium]|nr:thiamine-phosphate kinase [Acidobacteriota bacterium]
MSDCPTIADLGEHALVARIAARVPAPPPFVTLGIGDDAAIVEPVPRRLEVLTTDALVEDVHFTRALSSPTDVGHKALAVNLSDLAAMGATPRVALLSLALPSTLALDWFDAMLGGLVDLASVHGVALVGGNLTRSPGPIVLDVTLVGAVHPRKLLRRTTARAGDALYVTGRVGAAAAGLAWLQRESPADREAGPVDRPARGDADAMAEAVAAYRRPAPRVRIGRLVGRNRAASAAIDLSDGLADGVRRLAEGSGLGAWVDAALVPVHPSTAVAFDGHGDPLTRAIVGGDEYELLFAVPRRVERAFAAAIRTAADVPATRIGELVKSPGLVLRRSGGDDSWPRGYAHFA